MYYGREQRKNRARATKDITIVRRRGDPPRMHKFITNFTKREENYLFILISLIGNKFHEREGNILLS